jgi:hypothetical protein
VVTPFSLQFKQTIAFLPFVILLPLMLGMNISIQSRVEKPSRRKHSRHCQSSGSPASGLGLSFLMTFKRLIDALVLVHLL